MKRADFIDGEFKCPKCGTLLSRARFGAIAKGIEAWCRRCKMPVLIEIDDTQAYS